MRRERNKVEEEMME